MKTERFNNMIEAFGADFSLALCGDNKLQELNAMIKSGNKKLMQDIDLLQELDMLLRYGKAEIHLVDTDK